MKKILVIDYDQNSLATLHAILTKLGYQVITAADGQAGWDKYNKESPDLVLMEAMLPKVHGFELCQRITSERNSQATVFIMTGVYKDRVYRTEALRTYGASEYFEKPLKMSELLASIEAVLGKPEPRAAVEELEERPAAAASAPSGPVRANHPAPASPDPPKREKPLTDDERFALPDDLDKLSREIPKARKPAPARHEPPAEAKFESLADELIKKVIGESARPEQAVEPKPSGNNGNGNGSAEIDQFLKSALADLDLKKEKVKVPKTAPLPPPPVEAKPIPVPPPPAAFKPKPAPPAPRPETKFSAPVEPPPKITLTPGDPGSDISPFFTPVKLKPEAPAEKPKVQAPAVHPVADVQPPRPSKPVEKAETNPETVKHEPGKPVKINYEPVKHEPVQTEAKDKEAEAIASSGLFGDISSAHAKKGPSPLLLVGAAVAVIAVAGFLVLRPKKPAPVEETLQPQQTVTQESVPEQKVEEVPPPEVKPAPVKPKAEPKAKLEELGPAGVEAIMTAAAPPLSGTQGDAKSGGSPSAAASVPEQAVPPPVKTEETATPVNTEPSPTQPTATGTGAATDPGTAPPAPAPAGAPVKEGDLVDLASVPEPPKVLKSVDPVYPTVAEKLGVGGTITVNALIDEKGNVIDTGILKGIQDDKGLAKAAETAVKKWRFQPAKKNGVPVKVWKSFAIAFRPMSKSGGSTE